MGRSLRRAAGRAVGWARVQRELDPRHAVVIDVGAARTRSATPTGCATIGPGARLGDVYATLAAKGVTVPAGSCPTVAIGGLVLGGGMGLAGRAMGLTIDRVSSFDLVTADGTRHRIDDGDELFWALRRGGGASGSSPPIRLSTRRIGPAAYFSLGLSDRDEALERWDAFAPTAPPP